MACSSEKVIITRLVDNVFEFVIKQTDSTLPMEIVTGDTFSAQLVELGSDTVVLEKDLTVVDELSGRVSLTITEIEAAELTKKQGAEVDRYYLKPVYKLIIECDTQNNGKFTAKVNEVYVD